MFWLYTLAVVLAGNDDDEEAAHYHTDRFHLYVCVYVCLCWLQCVRTDDITSLILIILTKYFTLLRLIMPSVNL